MDENTTMPPTQTVNQPPLETHTSSWIVLFLLVVFQPAAFHIMYREKRYHHWFVYLLWLSAISQLIFAGIQLLFINPQLETLYKRLGVSYNTNLSLELIIFMVLSVIEIGIGILLLKKLKEEKALYKKFLILAIVILSINMALGALSIAYSVISTISPLYNLTSQLQ